MGFEDDRIPQGRGSATNSGVDSLQHDGLVRAEQLAVPPRLFAARDDGQRLPLVQVVLPVGKVDSKT